MKLEWKRQERELYSVKDRPRLLTVPSQRFIMLAGEGDPNGEDFSQRVGVLYSLAYAVKMRFKKTCAGDEAFRRQYDYDDYAVYPLEGVWTSSNPGDPLDKASYQYKIMIRQPDFITGEMFDTAYDETAKKKPHQLLEGVEFGEMTEGKCIQILHAGSYDSEPESFARMDSFAEENGLKRLYGHHREIYLNDARKTAPEKRRTILRYQV